MKKNQIALGIKFRGFSYEECFKIAKNTGFNGIDFLPSYAHLFFPPRDVIRYSKLYNVPVISMHEQLQLVFYTPRLLFSRMLYLTYFFPQVDTYVVHLSSLLNQFQYNTKKIEQFVFMAKQKGITISFESNPLRTFLFLQRYPKETYDPDTFAKFCITNNLAITFDTSHIASVGGDIIDFYKKYHLYISVIHLSDFKDGIEHLPLGQGSLPIDRLFQEIKKTKLNYKIILEINTFPYAMNKKNKQEDIKRSIELVKTYLT